METVVNFSLGVSLQAANVKAVIDNPVNELLRKKFLLFIASCFGILLNSVILPDDMSSLHASKHLPYRIIRL